MSNIFKKYQEENNKVKERNESQFNAMKEYINSVDCSQYEFGTKPLADLSPKEELRPFYVVIAAIISSLTNEQSRLKIMKKLIEHFTVLTPEILSKTTEKELLPLLTCKFKENKAKYIIAT